MPSKSGIFMAGKSDKRIEIAILFLTPKYSVLSISYFKLTIEKENDDEESYKQKFYSGLL